MAGKKQQAASDTSTASAATSIVGPAEGQEGNLQALLGNAELQELLLGSSGPVATALAAGEPPPPPDDQIGIWGDRLDAFRCPLIAGALVDVVVGRQDAIDIALTHPGATVVMPAQGVRNAFIVYELETPWVFSELSRENCTNITGVCNLHASEDVEVFVTTDGFVADAATLAFDTRAIEGLAEAGVEALGRDPIAAFSKLLPQVFEAMLEKAEESLGEQRTKDPEAGVPVARRVKELDEEIAVRSKKIWDLSTQIGKDPNKFVGRRIREILARLEAERNVLWRERSEALAPFPVIANIDPESFLATDPAGRTLLVNEACGELVGAIHGLKSANHAGDIELWGLSPLVVATLEFLGIPGNAPVRADLIEEAERRKADQFFWDMALLVFEVGAAIGGMVASGGLGAAFAVAGALAGMYDAAYMTEDWLLKKDLSALKGADPALDLLTPDNLSPKGYEVALAWIGLGLDVMDVVVAVKAVRKWLRGGDKLALAIEQVASDLGVEAKVLREAMESGAGLVVHEAHLPILSQRLGIDVVFDEDLGKGCALDFPDPKTWTPTVFRVGRDAQLFDVLGHKLVIDSARRYEGFRGTLREVFDALGGGGGPIHPRGSEAWHAHQEIDKLLPMIDQLHKRADDLIDGPLAEELLTEARHLESRVAYFEEVLAGLAAGLDPRVVARMTQQTREALDKGFPPFEDAVVAGKRLDPEKYWYVAQGGDPPYKVFNARDAAVRVAVEAKPSGGYRLVEAAEQVRHIFGDDTSKADALDFLCQPGKSMGPYRDMLLAWGVASDEGAILARMPNPVGQTEDDVRSALKKAFEDDVLRRMFYDGSEKLPPEDSIETYRKMTAGTAGLASSDFGNLGEKWYREFPVHHPPMRALEPHPYYETPAGKIRRPDFVEGSTAIEVKATRQGLNANHDIPQIMDLCAQAKAKGKGVLVNGEVRVIDKARVVFLDPAGASGSLDALERLFDDYNRYFEVEVSGLGIASTLEDLENLL